MLTQQTIRHLNHREGSKSRIDRTTKNLLSLSRWIFARNRFTPCLSLSFSFSPMGYDRTTRTRRRQATRQDTRVIRGRGRETIHQQEPPRGCYPLPSVSSAIGRLSPPGEYANFSGGVERDRDSMIRAKVPWCAATAVFFYFFLFFFFFFFLSFATTATAMAAVRCRCRSSGRCERPTTVLHGALTVRLFGTCSNELEISRRRLKDLGESWTSFRSFWCFESPARRD